MDTNILAVLAWVAGPGLAAITAFVLERLDSFDELSGNGKLVVAIAVAGVCGVAATAATQVFAADASLVEKWQPYANVIVPLVALAVQQLAHGKQKIEAEKRAIEAKRTPQDKAVDTNWQG